MRRFALIAVVLVTAWMTGDHPMSAQQAEACEFKYRRGIPEVEQAREAKKGAMRRNGVPDRYLHLVDNYECIACIETAPDTVHVTIIYKEEYAPRMSDGTPDTKYEIKLTPQIERQLRDDLASRRIESFHVWMTENRTGCRCCPDDESKQKDDYDDWNSALELNMDQVVSFDDPSDLPPLPDDLKRAPAGWVPPPPIENFSKPRRRYLHVTCAACQKLADEWNTVAGTLDFLWDRKVSLQRQINNTEHAMGNRRNEINDLEYNQRFDTSRNYDRMTQIEELKQVNADQQAMVEREERELADVEAQITETEARMAAIMEKVIACEKACRTRTTTNTTATTTGGPGPVVTETPVTETPATETAVTPPAGPTTHPAEVAPPPSFDGGFAAPLNVSGDETRTTPPGTETTPDEAVSTNDADGIRIDPDAKTSWKETTISGNADSGVFVEPCEGAGCTASPSEVSNLWDLRGDRRSFQKEDGAADARAIGSNAIYHNAINGDCSGPDCGDEWKACTDSNTCPDIDLDCGVPGTCSAGSRNDIFDYNIHDSSAWNTASTGDAETRIQIKIGEFYFDVVIRPLPRQGLRQWFNPLGLLARRLTDNMERWHGSAGPRPLIRPRDLALVDEYTGAQNAGLPTGLHVLLTDRGGSTGKTLQMQVLNLTGQAVRLSGMPFAIEPIKQQAQARVQQAFNRLAKAAPVNVDLAAYCVEFLKLPPAANQIFRLAPAPVQKKYAAMSKVLRSAYRIQHAGALRPDSNPDAYTDSIKQWAVWAVEQKFNERSFTEAFLGHTKKNVEAAGQQWSRPAEDMVRKVSPNRWRDIVKVLQGAGVPVPR